MSQNVFILLFRGINVGGNKIVRMETLRKVLSDAGFENVSTYIQSGNVVLTSDKTGREVTETVEGVFTPAFAFSSRPTVRSLKEWQQLIAENPFAETAEAGNRVHAVLVDARPTEASLNALEALATSEQIDLRNGVLYLHTPDGFGRSKVAAALDKTLKVPLTARNWNTVLKLQQMAEDAAKGD